MKGLVFYDYETRTFEKGINEIFFRVIQADDFFFDGALGNQTVDRYRRRWSIR